MTQPHQVSTDEIITKITLLLQKETEYPLDMLDPKKSLEAELGIDSITQAEVLATMRKEYQLPLEQNFRLRDYATIESWANYLVKRLSGN